MKSDECSSVVNLTLLIHLNDRGFGINPYGFEAIVDDSARVEGLSAHKILKNLQMSPSNSRNTNKRQRHNANPVNLNSSTPKEPRHWTLTMAIPGEILNNAKTPEFKTYLVGQIARAAALYHVDEIVIFRGEEAAGTVQSSVPANVFVGVSDRHASDPSFDPCTFMVRLLQYLETPPYLRKQLFPFHRDLQFAGLLNPLDCPHHTRNYEQTPFREGLVNPPQIESASMIAVPNPTADIGMHTPCIIDKRLPELTRVTVQLQVPYKVAKSSKLYSGKVVSPSTPRVLDGTYWGYQTRLASSGLSSVFTECPHKDGYDLTIGVSTLSGRSLDEIKGESDNAEEQTRFKHALIVFGGVQGIGACVDGDSLLTHVSAENSSDLFDWWMDPCPSRGSRSLRPEESVLITLETLRSTLKARGVESYI